METRVAKTKLSKLNKFSCLIITEELVGIPTLHIAVVTEAKLASLRLGNTRTLRGIFRNKHLSSLDKLVNISLNGIILDGIIPMYCSKDPSQ